MNQKEVELFKMNQKLLKVVCVIDDCVGIEIPSSMAKEMMHISKDLKKYLEQQTVEEKDDEKQ